MSTLSDIFIRHPNKEQIITCLSKYYKIGRIESYTEPKPLRYYEAESNNRTFVVHKDKNDRWTQIEFEMGESTKSLKEFDPILIDLTEQYKTKAMIAYEQTTSGSCRFAFFEDGKVVRSIIQTYLYPDDKIRITENVGKKFDFERYQYSTPIGEEIDYTELLSYYNDFQPWLRELGFEWVKENDRYNDYIHCEILDKK